MARLQRAREQNGVAGPKPREAKIHGCEWKQENTNKVYKSWRLYLSLQPEHTPEAAGTSKGIHSILMLSLCMS